MDARVNKISSCKIPDQYPKNKKVRTLATLAENKRNNSEYNSVVFTTLKKNKDASNSVTFNLKSSSFRRWMEHLYNPFCLCLLTHSESVTQRIMVSNRQVSTCF